MWHGGKRYLPWDDLEILQSKLEVSVVPRISGQKILPAILAAMISPVSLSKQAAVSCPGLWGVLVLFLLATAELPSSFSTMSPY